MIHKRRRFVLFDCESIEEMASKLHHHSWCLCNGFRAGHLTLLNDAFSEDSAQEFAVFHDAKPGVQIESLTVSWFESEERLRTTLERLDADPATGVESEAFPIRSHDRTETCEHCA